MSASDAIALYHKGDANSGGANRRLWAGDELTPEQHQYVSALDLSMKPTTESRVVFRGKDYNYGAEKLPQFKVGDRISQSGFVSTSRRKKTAHDFARSSPQINTFKDKGGVLLQITLPPGTGVIDVPNFAGGQQKGRFYNEEETLLQRGGELVVDKVRTVGGVTTVEATFVPPAI